MSNICFDTYVADMNDIEDNVDGYEDSNKDKNCNFFAGKNVDRTRNDIINNVSPATGCCFSRFKTNVINVKTSDELESYIEKLKEDYKKVFSDRDTKLYLDMINTSNTLELLKKKRNINTIKSELNPLLKHYQRLFLGIEQDVGKLKKMVSQVRNVNPFDDITTFNNENNKLKNFRDTGSEEQKLFFHDRSSYEVYETSFYGMLCLVGILFLRTQFKN